MIAQLEHVMQSAQRVPCPTCGTDLVTKRYAIGRTYTRCPKCDRVAPQQRRHPDEVLMPQALVRVQPLSSIEPGQLRCQVCARGVEGRARLCQDCQHAAMRKGGRRSLRPRKPCGTNDARVYQPKVCGRCDAVYTPTGPRQRFCPECR